MNELKVTPFSFGGNTGDAVYAYIDNNTGLNQDQKNEIELRVNNHDKLVDLATKHATRADELSEVLECICSYLSEDGLTTTGLAKEIVNAQRVLNKSRIEAEEGL